MDFLLSYADTDQGWAEWIAWQLEVAGHTVLPRPWNFRSGGDWSGDMRAVTPTAARTIALLSPAYAAARAPEEVWRLAFDEDPAWARGRLLPVRVEPVEAAALEAAGVQVQVDLTDLEEPAAAAALLAGIREETWPARSSATPAFPGILAAAELPPGPAFPGPGPAVANLPSRNPHFTGREELFDQLAEQLLDGVAVVTAAGGLPGVGVSQLALEYAHRNVRDYKLVWWLAAGTPLLLTNGLDQLGQRLGVPVHSDLAEQAAEVLAELRYWEPWLLVFDGAGPAATAQPYWPSEGNGQVLITSGEPAWGEFTALLHVDLLPEQDAAALLLARSGSSNTAAARRLAGAVGGLPLALEHAAAYTGHTGVFLTETLDRYQRSRPEQPAGVASAADAATATCRLSLDQLAGEAPAAAALLRLCAFLAPAAIGPGLLTSNPAILPEGLAAVCSDRPVLDQAAGILAGLALVTADQDGLRLHEAVQAAVRERLGPGQERAWAAAAMGLVMARFPEDAIDEEAWPACASLLAHALTASGHAERLRVAADEAGTVLNRLGRYLRQRAQLPDARECFERALAVDQAFGGPQHPSVARDVNNLGDVLQEQGDLAGAKASYERALAIDEAANGADDPTVAIDLTNLGDVLRQLGDLPGAETRFRRALAIDEAAYGPDDPVVARDAANLGVVLHGLGDLPEAKAAMERALTIDQAAYGPDDLLVARDLDKLGAVLQEAGDLAGAQDCLERAAAIRERDETGEPDDL